MSSSGVAGPICCELLNLIVRQRRNERPKMRFLLGQPPDDTSYHADPGAGWRKVRWIGPRAMITLGSLLGIPLAVLIGFFWSRMPLPPLKFSINSIGLGSWSGFLLSLIIIIVIAVCLIVLVIAHEFIHLLAFPNFGLSSATVFGIWPSRLLPYAYHSGPVTCRRMIVVALAPFIVLSVSPLIASYIGLLRSPLSAIFSILNSVACGGDVAVCLMLAYQVPIAAVVQSKDGDTWWIPAEQAHALEPAVGPDSNGESSPPAQ